jgi:D-alanyl-D-alanine carboxypeptidase
MQKSPSAASFDSQKTGISSIFEKKGISLGASKAVNGVVSGLGRGEHIASRSASASGRDDKKKKRSWRKESLGDAS